MADFPGYNSRTGGRSVAGSLAFPNYSAVTVPQPEAPPDPSVPTIVNVTPAALSQLAVDEVVSFEVVRTSGLLKAFVWVYYADLESTEMVFDGVSFMPNFELCTVTPTYAGPLLTELSFSLRRTGGWLSRPTLRGTAFGVQGQELA